MYYKKTPIKAWAYYGLNSKKSVIKSENAEDYNTIPMQEIMSTFKIADESKIISAYAGIAQTAR